MAVKARDSRCDQPESRAAPERAAADEPRLADMRALVIGMGKTGIASARFLAGRGADVLLTDTRDEAELGEKWEAAQRLGVATQAGLTDAASLGRFDLAVVSPGLPLDTPAVGSVRTEELVSEIELASWFCTAPVIAVAGTNGKGTTSTLLGEMLTRSGRQVVVAGNIGSPLVDNVESIRQSDFAVVEVSSFQLEAIRRFRPKVAVLLNITPDHLEHHGSLENYVSAKGRLFRNQTGDDHAVLNADDELVLQAAKSGRARRALFSLSDQPDVGAFIADDQITVRTDPEVEPTPVCALSEMPMAGAHNTANVLAAALAATLCGASAAAIAEGVRAYRPSEHVMERVAVVAGVTYINDTKATNHASAAAAMEAVDGPIVLIAGGKDKGADLRGFGALAAGRARVMFLIGETAGVIAQSAAAAGGPSPVMCDSLEEAVRRSADAAQPGDTVLLAPACSSHDMFEDYAQRGRRFREAVQRLADERGN